MKIKWVLWILWVGMLNAQQLESSQISVFTVKSPQLGRIVTVRVYLPQYYADNAFQYPVLYLQDGQNLFDKDTAYAGEWEVDEALDSLHSKLIVVGIDHGEKERLNELTPYTNSAYGGGKGDLYARFIEETLIPTVNKKYRTKRGRKNTYIGGSSLGGLISFYIALKYQHLFSKALIFSPSFWFSEDIYGYVAKQTSVRCDLYFLCGADESETMVADNEKMYRMVNQRAASRTNIQILVVPQGQHNEALWHNGFIQTYDWLTRR